jgi:hypothetical protein
MSEHRYSATGLLAPGESTSLLALLEQGLVDPSNEIGNKLSGWSLLSYRIFLF